MENQPTLEAPNEHDEGTAAEHTHVLATPAAPGSAGLALPELQRAVRRQQAYRRDSTEDLVWQPRFAYSAAAVVLVSFAIVSLPLWLVLYRISEIDPASGGGPQTADLIALGMMLLGGFLASATTWVIIVEMRGRVRMVDTLARTSEREAIGEREALVSAEPVTTARVGPGAGSPEVAMTGSAMPANPAATLEASGKLLTAFSGVLRAFGQLSAQVAVLAVALALFVGATLLSLR